MPTKYRSLSAQVLGLRQGLIVKVVETDLGLEIYGVNPSAEAAVLDGVQYDHRGRLGLRQGSLLQRAGVQLKVRRGK